MTKADIVNATNERVGFSKKESAKQLTELLTAVAGNHSYFELGNILIAQTKRRIEKSNTVSHSDNADEFITASLSAVAEAIGAFVHLANPVLLV